MSPDEDMEVIQERIDWKTGFNEAMFKLGKLIRNRHDGAADVALDIYGKIPTQYFDHELRLAWEAHYIEHPDLKKNDEQLRQYVELQRAFWDWANRQGMLLKKEFGDPLEVLWMTVKQLVRQGDVDQLAVHLDVEGAVFDAE